MVGVGASAGGLDAYKKFLSQLPPRSGMAFVLIQHLDPSHESMMADLLGRHTSMKVAEVVDGMRVEPDRVYMIPPNNFLAVRGGHLKLVRPIEARGIRMPIDYFFRSLAEDQGERGICIILSGTGTDGTLGLKAVKEHGGMAMVQSSHEAAYDGMPNSAIATGLADFVLPIEQMPEVLLNYVRHFYVNGETNEDVPANHLNQILALMRSRVAINFGHYKKNTLSRRIERRMGIKSVHSMKDYLALLRENDEEIKLLLRDLLISVTSFFRDPEAMRELRDKVVSGLLDRKTPPASMRVWVPGCATGEEAYSVAILLFEAFSLAQVSPELQIFATDVDVDALEFGRNGVYPESIAADMSPERLSRFFTKEGETYQVNKQLRDAVLFARQNILQDPPFSKLDLVSCRNLLIYIETDVQKKVIPLLHFALKEGGLLFLGPSESVGRHGGLFEPLSRKAKIFRSLPGGRAHLQSFPFVAQEERAGHPTRSSAERGAFRSPADVTQRTLLARFAPAAVLIDRRYQILFFQGDTSRFLTPPSGEPSLDLLAMARTGLRTKLRGAIYSASRSGDAVVLESLRLRTDDGGYRRARVTVQPVEADEDGSLLVVFEELPPEQPDAPDAGLEPDAGGDNALRQMELELSTTREELQSTIEELETSNEELKASNEEAMSMNEELQSTNEELETSKEELQSLNEELSTVNSQLQDKVEELEATNNDLYNLFSSTEVVTVFLDTNLCIRRFTPSAGHVFNVIPTDIGRPLSNISHGLVDDELQDSVSAVLRDLVPREVEVASRDGKWYLRRTLPYRTADNKIDGVLITLSDVTHLKSTELRLRRSEMSLSNAQRLARSGSWDWEPAEGTFSCSQGLCELLDVQQVEPSFEAFLNLVPEHDRPTVAATLRHVSEGTRNDALIEHRIETARGQAFEVVHRIVAETGDGRATRVHGVVMDVSQTRAVAAALEQSQSFLNSLVLNSPVAIMLKDVAGKVRLINPTYTRWFGSSAEQVVGHQDHELYSDELARTLGALDEQALQTGRVVETTHSLKLADDQEHTLRFIRFPIQNASGSEQGLGIMGLDLTNERRLQESLSRGQKLEAVGRLSTGIAHEFNNLMMVITGSLGALRADFPDSDDAQRLVDQALAATERGTQLTNRLLSYSRRQMLRPRGIELNAVVEGCMRVVASALEESVVVEVVPSSGPLNVYADEASMESALVNLVLNSRDAMPGGGKVLVRLNRELLGADDLRADGNLVPGPYASLCVEDDGEGMSPQTVQRAFDPFFTTKAIGRGTGLGLSQVHGFVEQSSGFASIESREGSGTKVTLYFPLKEEAKEPVPAPPPPKRSGAPPRGDETILLVEDNQMVRTAIRVMLTALGYTVVEAASGDEAFELLQAGRHVDLLLTDAVMPGRLSGPELIVAARELQPNMKCVCATGYAERSTRLRELPQDVLVLRKPFEMGLFARHIRDLLDSAGRRG